MHPVIAILLQAQPADIPGLALLQQLADHPPTNDELLQLEPELEQAVYDLDKLAYDSGKVIQKCDQLKPTPAPTAPPGF